MATCRKNHVLFQHTREELAQNEFKFFCAFCRMEYKSPRCEVYYCSKCSYDMCSTCYRKETKFCVHATKANILCDDRRHHFLQICQKLQS